MTTKFCQISQLWAKTGAIVVPHCDFQNDWTRPQKPLCETYEANP